MNKRTDEISTAINGRHKTGCPYHPTGMNSCRHWCKSEGNLMSKAPREEKYKHCAVCQDSPPGPCCWCSGPQQWDVNMGQLSYFTWAKLCIQCVSMLSIRKTARGACWPVFKDMQYILFFPPQRDQQGQQSLAVSHHSWLLHMLNAIIPPYTPTAEMQPPVTFQR